ncbi:hypothetical protein Bca52824_087165 [Brassica carinata]|uniref:BRCT domain-containing protein n=1 Tax=Brassica carinata TaxID=52824 RepID=A0A8X7PAT6_BRACI|nr:hypothetical protein Bca52824_087165 [Brassica carinata]
MDYILFGTLGVARISHYKDLDVRCCNCVKSFVLLRATICANLILEFAEVSGVTISRKWEPRVTHVIASTNENGACKRTLKFMMAILEGKWILSIDWIKACMKDREYVSEELYEISIDVHGTRQGPFTGRQKSFEQGTKTF